MPEAKASGIFFEKEKIPELKVRGFVKFSEIKDKW